jgi:hypothetical protein
MTSFDIPYSRRRCLRLFGLTRLQCGSVGVSYCGDYGIPVVTFNCGRFGYAQLFLAAVRYQT